MNYSSRFFLYAPFAVLLAVFAVIGLLWWQAARALEARLAAMLTREAMPGVTVRYREMTVGGFPFRLEAVFKGFSVSVATRDGPVVWRAEDFALHGLTYGRDETIYEAAGRQRLEWGHGRGLDFQTGSLHASAIRDAGGLVRFDLDLVALGSRAVTASRLQLHLRRGADGIDVAASGDGLRLARPGALGREIKTATLQGTVSVPRAFDGLRAGRARWQSALEAWRQGQGTLHLDALHAVADPLDVMGQGNIGFDAAHRLSGLIDFKLAGIADWLRRDAHGAFADAIRVRAANAGANEAGKLGIVLGARDGVAYLGEAPVDTVEPLY